MDADNDNVSHKQCLGAVLYRAGRLSDALKLLTTVAESEHNEQSSPAYCWYFLGMTHHQLGSSEAAEKWLTEAVQWTDKVAQDEENPIRLNRRLTLELLKQEAKTLIRPESHSEKAGR